MDLHHGTSAGTRKWVQVRRHARVADAVAHLQGRGFQVLAAHRAGLHRVILPKRNERDLDDIPKDIRESMEFILAEDMHEVIDAALVKHAAPQPQTSLSDEAGLAA